MKETIEKIKSLVCLSLAGTTLLPFAACFVGGAKAAELAVIGCLVFTLMTWLFSSMMDRLSSGPAAKAAPILSAFGLYLAVQGLMGMIL